MKQSGDCESPVQARQSASTTGEKNTSTWRNTTAPWSVTISPTPTFFPTRPSPCPSPGRRQRPGRSLSLSPTAVTPDADIGLWKTWWSKVSPDEARSLLDRRLEDQRPFPSEIFSSRNLPADTPNQAQYQQFRVCPVSPTSRLRSSGTSTGVTIPSSLLLYALNRWWLSNPSHQFGLRPRHHIPPFLCDNYYNIDWSYHRLYQIKLE